ncbi:hypothetical protein B0H11DRAFT_1923881 [Mycena galericulata]|nr:hypothetical protein B0H11DRAFT_1923881 [Mycena galericulata]
MTDPQTVELFGWNHTNICWQIFHHRQPRRKTELTLNLVAQFTYVANAEDDNSRVYTPMDFDDSAVYSPMDVDDPKLYTPMDVDDSDGFHPGGTAWNSFDHNTTSAQHDEELQASRKHVHSENTPPDGKPLIDVVSEQPPPFKFFAKSGSAAVGELGFSASSDSEINLQGEMGGLETQQTAHVPFRVPTHSLAHI